MGYKMPRALTIEEIHDLVERFGDAAVRCKKLVLKLSKSTVLPDIFRPISCLPTIINVLICMVALCTTACVCSWKSSETSKKKCGPNFPVGVKLSTEDWEPEGIRIEETIEVAKALEKEGVSHLNIMGGTHATASREFLLPNAFNAKHTKMLKDAVNIPVFIGHNIFSPEDAEKMLAEGNADFVALGRSQLAEPAWQKSKRRQSQRY